MNMYDLLMTIEEQAERERQRQAEEAAAYQSNYNGVYNDTPDGYTPNIPQGEADDQFLSPEDIANISKAVKSVDAGTQYNVPNYNGAYNSTPDGYVPQRYIPQGEADDQFYNGKYPAPSPAPVNTTGRDAAFDAALRYTGSNYNGAYDSTPDGYTPNIPQGEADDQFYNGPWPTSPVAQSAPAPQTANARRYQAMVNHFNGNSVPAKPTEKPKSYSIGDMINQHNEADGTSPSGYNGSYNSTPSEAYLSNPFYAPPAQPAPAPSNTAPAYDDEYDDEDDGYYDEEDNEEDNGEDGQTPAEQTAPQRDSRYQFNVPPVEDYFKRGGERQHSGFLGIGKRVTSDKAPNFSYETVDTSGYKPTRRQLRRQRRAERRAERRRRREERGRK